MGALSDFRFDALRGQGFTGSTSDMLLQWLHANGATSPAIPDAWREFLDTVGFSTGHRNDDWYAYLGSLGYVGQLNDREYKFWGDGGVVSPDGVRITDQPSDWSGIEGANATFTVVATSGNASPLTYQWQEYVGSWGDIANGGRVSGATTDTLTISSVVVEDNLRRFRVQVCNSYNCIFSNSATLRLTGATWFILDEAGNRTITEVAPVDPFDNIVDERSV